MKKPNIVLLILVLVFFLGIIGMILWFLQPEEDRNTSQSQSEENTDSCDPRDLSCSPWVITIAVPYCFRPSEGDDSKSLYSSVIYFLNGKPVEVSASQDPNGEVRFVGEYDGKHLNLVDKKGYHRDGTEVDISADLSSDYQKMDGTYYTVFRGEVWNGCEGAERKVYGPFTARRCQGNDCQVD